MTDDRPDQITFDLEDDSIEIEAGFAILVTKDVVNGASITAYHVRGEIEPQTLVGMLITAADQLRWEFKDISESQIIGMLEEAAEEDGENG